MNGKELASAIKFKSDYSKWMTQTKTLESWRDATEGRVMGMHRINPRFEEAFKNERFKSLFEKSSEFYGKKLILASQRALQYAADPIFKKNARQYNCSATYVDRPRVFQEIMWVLLCGAGVGYSVQKYDIDQLPSITPRTLGTKTFVIEDSIEGWSDAIGVLMSSYFTGTDVPFPEYQGYEIKFDFSLIRPKGSFISGGFKAPGPNGLKKALENIEALVNNIIESERYRLDDLDCHDIICYSADAVISGGVRRSALICQFDRTSKRMLRCKTGDWYITNPQRKRANNSAVFVIGEFTKEELDNFKITIKEFGEPGFILVKSDRFVYNPCAEIGFFCYCPETGKSGFSFCNVNETNGSESTTPEIFYEQCETAAFIGTLQAAYDSFDYLGPVTESIVRSEALLGVGINGWMNNPQVLFNPEVLAKGAKIVLETNEWVAKLIGINPTARATTSKPGGNSGVILGLPGGMNTEHSRKHFRLMVLNKQLDITNYIKETAPSMIEHYVHSSTGSDDVVYIPIEVDKKAILKKDITGVEFLEKVKIAKRYWVDEGKVQSRCLHPDLSHNISNTVTVDDWDAVFDYIWENQADFSGISFMAETGDKAYNQAPFTEVLTPEEILEKYGNGALLASGLIVDGLDVFPNLWDALDHHIKKDTPFIGTHKEKLLMKDWIRRVKQFSTRYLKGDINRTVDLLLDVNNWHRWMTIKREMKKLDIENFNFEPDFIEVDTMASIACVGGSCAININ